MDCLLKSSSSWVQGMEHNVEGHPSSRSNQSWHCFYPAVIKTESLQRLFLQCSLSLDRTTHAGVCFLLCVSCTMRRWFLSLPSEQESKVRVPQLSTRQTEIYWFNETIRPSLDTILLIYKINAVNFALLSAGKRCHLKFCLLTWNLQEMLVLMIDTHISRFVCTRRCTGVPTMAVEAEDQPQMLFLRSCPCCPSPSPFCQGLSLGTEARSPIRLL